MGLEGQDFGLRIGGTAVLAATKTISTRDNGGLVAVNGLSLMPRDGRPDPSRHSVNGAPKFPARRRLLGFFSIRMLLSRRRGRDLGVRPCPPTLERQTVEAALMAVVPDRQRQRLPSSAAVTVRAANAGLTAAFIFAGGGGCVSNGTLTVTGTVAPDGVLSVTAQCSLPGLWTECQDGRHLRQSGGGRCAGPLRSDADPEPAG